MTWANTPLKDTKLKKDTKTELNNQSNELIVIKEQIHEEGGDEDIISINEEKQQQKPIEEDLSLYYTDEEYLLRKPHKAYLQYNLIENRVLEIKNPNIKTYIICPGLLYGKGEQIFFDYFKMSWLNEPIQLITQGDNTIPTLHIKDLVTLIKRIIHKKPTQKYIIGIDQTKNKTLKGIMTAISKTIGNGRIDQLDTFDINTINIPHFDEMSINVKVKPSQIFFDERRENEDKEDYEKRSFKWSCQYGIAGNMEKIHNEFIQYKQLTTLKIIILGMPYSGKTLIGNALSKMFNLPLLNIGDIIRWGKEELDDDLSKEVKNKIEEITSKLKEEEEAYNKRPNKKKTDPPFDTHQASKLPIELVVKLVHSYIKHKSECYTHGYILDGFPKTFNEANLLHLDNETKEILTDTLPHNVIILDNCPEEFVLNRMKETKDYQNDPNLIQERMTRRLLRHKDNHDKEIAPKTVEQFYRDKNVEIIKIDITQMINSNTFNKKNLITICKDFLLKNGEYMKNCYHLGYSIPEFKEEKEEENKIEGDENDVDPKKDPISIKKTETEEKISKKNTPKIDIKAFTQSSPKKDVSMQSNTINE